MSLAPGTRIGLYEIEVPIGAGGMGAVYRARDTKLGRKVALKILPDSFTTDPDRVARFEREAQVLAALNHPHIAQIYGVDEGPSLVMELVDGSTLVDRIQQGPIPLDEARSIARQIAEALKAAHDKGIVHRDLKPSNIALTADGDVKVLDFGLAKLLEDSTGSAPKSDDDPSGGLHALTASPTMASPISMTRVGVMLGTAPYMSPEQAKGRAADKRSDVWAFGCVLYEMLTGRRAFGGDDISDTLAAVLAREPNWGALRGDVPRSLRTLLERCLAKDVRQRFADMSVVQFLLEQPVDPAPATAISTKPRWRERVAWLATASAGVAALALAFMHFSETKPEPPQTIRFTVAPPDNMTMATGISGSGVLSPDGTRIVFPVTPLDGLGSVSLAVRAFDEESPRLISGTDGTIHPFWSPDSQLLAYLGGGKLQRIAVRGGAPQVICETPGLAGGSWNRDDVIVFSPSNGPLLQVSARGGTPTPVTTLNAARHETSHRFPWFLPDGRHFLYLATGATSSIRVGSLDQTVDLQVIESDTNAIYANGYLLFIRQNTLLAQPFDVSNLRTAGDTVVVARDLTNAQTSNAGQFSASNTGLLAYRGAAQGLPTQLLWVDRTGKTLEKLGDPTDQTEVRLSPDGKRLAVSVFDPVKGARDIWIHDLSRSGARTRFTFGAGDEWSVAWSPDSTRLAFNGNPDGVLDLFEKPVDGTGSEERLGQSIGNNRYVTDWTGSTIVFNTGRTRSQTGNDIWILTRALGRAEDSKARALLNSSFNEFDAVVSRDGRWLAYTSDESGRDEVQVVPFSRPAGGKWVVSVNGGGWAQWSQDGRELFFVEGGGKRLMAATVDGRGDAFKIESVRPLFEARFRQENYLGYGTGDGFDVSPDGRRFLINVIGDTKPAPTPITVITNWPGVLK